MAGLMDQMGFMPPQQSPFGAMPQPGGYQPSPETLMLLEQLKRGGQGQSPLGQPPAPEAQPPGMVSPYAFAGGAGQMGQSVPAGAMGQMPPGLGTSLSPGAGQVTPASPDMPAPGASPSGPAPMPGQTAPGGVGFPGANGESYESIQRKRKFAEALLQQGMSSAPIQSWTQGANRLAQALIGGYQVGQANKSEKEQAKQFQETMLRALGMGGTPAQAGATPSPQTGAAQPPNGTLAAYAQAVAKVESGGRYDAMGPQTKSGDRAYGKYQVMGNNIPSWTKEVLGQSMTPQQFLANPQAQDAVFNKKFGGYMAKYGNGNDAVSMWFSGKPLSAAGNRSDGYNTVPQYLQKVLAALPGGGQAAAGSPAAPSAPAQMPQAGGMNPQAMMMAAMMNPSLSPQQKQTMMAAAQMAAQQGKVNYQTLPDGTILALDPNGRRPPTPVYQAQTKPSFGVIGKDQFGNEQYGFIDPTKRSVSPIAGQQPQPGPAGAPAQPGAMPAAPQGVPPPPPGVDPKVWRAEQTKKMVTPDKLTEGQSKDVGFYQRGTAANTLLDAKEGDLLDTKQAVLGAVPLVGNQLTGRTEQGKKYQAAQQAARDFLAVILRKDTGAAVTPKEFDTYGKIFLPQPGESPEVVAQKREARARALEGIRTGLGSVKELVEAARPKPATPGGPPKIGIIEQGYRFKGGNPADPKSWEKVQ